MKTLSMQVEEKAKSKIVVINGSGGCGKSTFVKLCKKINPMVVETSTIDYCKSIARCCGWDGGKSEKDRKFLSDLKCLLEEYSDTPNKKTDEFIQENSDNIIFVNVREPKNICRYVKKYSAKTLLIKNPRVSPIISNQSDKDVEDYNYDCIIVNDGSMEDFFDRALYYMKNQIIKE